MLQAAGSQRVVDATAAEVKMKGEMAPGETVILLRQVLACELDLERTHLRFVALGHPGWEVPQR